MMDANHGYVGWSMSRRAVEAYESGEMPKSKWTKTAIVDALKGACDELDLMYDPSVERMRKDELSGRFLCNSSWHHTGKFFNVTDFYAVDADAVAEAFRPMTENELAERQAARDKALADAATAREAMQKEIAEKASLRRAYRAENGFDPDTVAAFAREHPERCHERTSRKGNRVLSYIDYLGREQACPIDRIADTHLYGFDATEPGSFDWAIEQHQLLSTCEMPGNDRLTLKGEPPSGKVAVAAGYRFNLVDAREAAGIDLKGCGTVVTVDGHDYDVMKGATYEDSRKVDDLLDSHGDKPISGYRKQPQGMSLKQAAMESREASAKLAEKNGGTDDHDGKDER